MVFSAFVSLATSLVKEVTTQHVAVIVRLLEHWKQEGGNVPIADDPTLSSEPHHYMKWLHVVQQILEETSHVMEHKPEKFASKAYIRRQLQQLRLHESLSQRGFESLVYNTGKAINTPNHVFNTTKRTSSLDQEQVGSLHDFINNTKRSIQDGTFQPLKYTDPRGKRWFTLLPVYSTVNKHISIDSRALWSLTKGLRVGKQKPSEKNRQAYFEKVFDLSKLNFSGSNKVDKKCSFVVNTDGYSASFLFKQTLPKKTKEEKSKLFLPSMSSKVHQAVIWGVDPGVRAPFTAVDDSNRIRKISNTEYYQHIGMKSYKQFVDDHQNEHQAEYLFISELPSLKTANLDRFITTAMTRIHAYDRIRSYYHYVPHWAFKLYRNKQIYLDEVVKQLIGGSKKYSKYTTKNIAIKETPNIYQHPCPNENDDDSVAAPIPAPTVVLPPRVKVYDCIQDIYHRKFQLAKDDDYCIIEELGKIPVKIEYKSDKVFSSAKEAKAAMAHELLEARWCPLPRQ